MSHSMTRRQAMIAVAPVAILAGRAAAQPPGANADETPGLESFPAQDPRTVREIVGACHGNVDKVTALLKEQPRLANATYDWGFGDWETCLGAASHTGRRNIAAILLDHGARPDIFAFAMLGNLDAVKAMVAAQPGLQKTRGPHGITLLKHAKAGGAESAGVVKYLAAIGDADVDYADLPLADADRDACLGEYSFGPRPDQRLLIVIPKNQAHLSIQRVDGTPRPLFHKGNNVFHPAGSPETLIEIGGGLVRIRGSGAEVIARRS